MLEYFEHEAFNDYVNELTPSQIQKYMKAMMQALDYVVSCIISQFGSLSYGSFSQAQGRNIAS